jgi:hypothetical protein
MMGGANTVPASRRFRAMDLRAPPAIPMASSLRLARSEAEDRGRPSTAGELVHEVASLRDRNLKPKTNGAAVIMTVLDCDRPSEPRDEREGHAKERPSNSP